MSNDKDFKVKNGIQPASYQESLGTVVSGSAGYSISSTSYDSVSLDVSAQENNPTGVFFKDDGTKLYIVGLGGDEVNEYILSTAWDITTASANHAFSVAGQDTVPRGFTFSPDGTKMYICGDTGNDINQYTLSTAWNLSTASYTRNFSVSGQTTTPRGIHFKTDGTKMFVSGSQNTLEYALSTAWDISTALYTQAGADVSSSYNAGLFFTSDGLTMYKGVWFGITTSIYKYTLSTAWDLASAVLSETGEVQDEAGTTPFGVFLKPDGTKMWVVGNSTDTIYQYSTAQTTNTLDLSTGSVFEITPTSNIQVGLSNPAASGTVSQGTLLLSSEDLTGVSSAFSTTLYTGTGSTQTITNGIDLAGDGGMVWIKSRTTARYPTIVDTERGPSGGGLFTAVTNAADASTNYVSQFNSDGFQVENYAATNESGQNLVAWSFKKQTSFFDVVTWTGTGSARTIPHALSDEVGMIAVKRTSSSGTDWQVFHRALGSSPQSTVIYLNDTSGMATNNSRFNNTLPTNSVFSLSGDAAVNGSGETYVAYVFAHDTDASGIIKCGSFTTDSGGGATVELGWEPQFVMIKNIENSNTSLDNWDIMDTERGLANAINASYNRLRANTADVEAVSGTGRLLTPTGFQTVEYRNSSTYIYMAIRKVPPASTITYDSAIQFGGGTAPDSPAIGETDVLAFSTRDGGTSYQAMQAIDGAK